MGLGFKLRRLGHLVRVKVKVRVRVRVWVRVQAPSARPPSSIARWPWRRRGAPGEG